MNSMTMNDRNIAINLNGKNVGAAHAPRENKTGEVAPTTSPTSIEPTAKQVSTNGSYYSTGEVPVTTQFSKDNPSSQNGEAQTEIDGGQAYTAIVDSNRITASDIDLDSIAVDQDFAAMAAVKADSSAPPIRKPGNQLWFCPHPDQKFWKSFLTITDKLDSDAIYVLNRTLAEGLHGEYVTTLFVPCITPQEEFFIWPIKLPDSEGRIDSWNASKLEHALAGAGKWMRLRSNQFAGGYDKLSQSKQSPPPTWPDDILDLLKRGVTRTYIESLDHPLIKRLLGEN